MHTCIHANDSTRCLDTYLLRRCAPYIVKNPDDARVRVWLRQVQQLMPGLRDVVPPLPVKHKDRRRFFIAACLYDNKTKGLG